MAIAVKIAGDTSTQMGWDFFPQPVMLGTSGAGGGGTLGFFGG